MARIDISNLSPRDTGRLNKSLDVVYHIGGEVQSLRRWLEGLSEVRKAEGDASSDFNRRHFNRLGSTSEQAAYEARLKTRRKFYINDIEVPKMVYEAVRP